MLRKYREWGGLVLALSLCAMACKNAAQEKTPDKPSDPHGASLASGSVPAREAPKMAGVVEGATPGVRKPVRGVIVVSVDSLRADMPWNGYERAIAPRMSKFAESAVNYTHAYAISSYTSMSLGGFLGGTYPSELKRDGYFFGSYAQENVFFPEILKEQGVFTTSVQAHGYFKGNAGGFSQGFESWEVVPNITFNNTTDENMTGAAQEEMAERALAKIGDRRFFAWFHFMDPHDRYLPHPGISYGKKPRDLYDGEVTYTDEMVGKLLDFVDTQPWAKETAIVLTADHGEGFGEHGKLFHGFELWEELVRVPLLVKLPGAKPRTIQTPRGHVDLAPTILDLLGAKKGDSMRGTSLVAEVLGENAPAREVVMDLPVTSDNDLRRAVVFQGKKVIRFAAVGTRVFNLADDPGETTLLQGEARDEMNAVLKRVDDAIRFQPTTLCKDACLNGGYAKDAGAKDATVGK